MLNLRPKPSAPAAPARPAQRPMLGVAMIMVAVLFFAAADAITKDLTLKYNVPAVMAGRFIFSVLLLLIVLLPRHGTAMFRTHRTGLVLLRSLAMAIPSVLAAKAFQLLPLAETTAIVYLAPFGVLILSGLVLREKVRLSSWLAAGGGFLGLLLITRPGGGLDPVGVAFGLGAAALSIWYHLSSRLLADTESTIALMFYANLVGALILAALLPFNLVEVTPTLAEFGLMLVVAACAVIGHFLLTSAYREAPAALVAPLLYCHLIWAGVLGWAVFGHVPDGVATLGIVVVAISGAGLALWNRPGGRRAVP